MLSARGARFSATADGLGISLSVPIGGRSSSIEVRWIESPAQLRVTALLPLQVPQHRYPVVLATINTIHQRLALLGFVLDTQQGIVTFQALAPADEDGTLNRFVVDAYLTTAMNTAEQHARVLHAAALG